MSFSVPNESSLPFNNRPRVDLAWSAVRGKHYSSLFECVAKRWRTAMLTNEMAVTRGGKSGPLLTGKSVVWFLSSQSTRLSILGSPTSLIVAIICIDLSTLRECWMNVCCVINKRRKCNINSACYYCYYLYLHVVSSDLDCTWYSVVSPTPAVQSNVWEEWMLAAQDGEHTPGYTL